MFRATFGYSDPYKKRPDMIRVHTEVDSINLYQGIDYSYDNTEDFESFAYLLPGAPISVNAFRIIMARLMDDTQLEMDYLYQEDLNAR